MANRERYAQWLIDNQDKAGTPEFETIAKAYRAIEASPQIAEVANDRAIAGPEQPERLIADQDNKDAPPGNRWFSGEIMSDFLGVPEELRAPVKSRAGFGQRMAGGDAARFYAGRAEPIVGAIQIGAMGVDAIRREMGQDSNIATAIGQQWKRLKEYQSGGRPDPEAFDAARMAGNVVTGVQAAARVPQATSVPGRIAQGSAVGATLSATQPALSDSPVAETISQATTGAVVGAAVPALGAVGRMAYDRFIPGGVERSAARLANLAAGDRQPQVVAELRRSAAGQRAGTVRPNITAGEAAAPAGSAEFSALQQQAMQRVDPSVRVGIDRAASRIRESQLRSIGGTSDTLQAAQARVSQQVGALYKTAFEQPFKRTAAITASMRDPFVIQAERSIRPVAASQGIKRGSSEYMHLIKKGLDDIVSAPAIEGGLRPTQQRAAAIARDRFLTAFEKANPAYSQARQQSAELYRPLGQMQVAQNLEQRLSAPIVDQGGNVATQRAASFAQGLRDAPGTVRRATGFRGQQTIEDVMTPDQMATINRVGRDLANRADFDELARAGTTRVNAMLGNMYAKQVAPMLSRVMMIANNILKRTAVGASERGMKVLAEKMQSPAEMARIMEAATAAERVQINNLLNAISSQSAGRGVTDGFGFAEQLMRRSEESPQ
jgi:hypothetical protein